MNVLTILLIGLKAIGQGALLSIPAVGFGLLWHKLRGQPIRWVPSLIICVIAAFIKLLWLKRLPDEWFGYITIMISSLPVYWSETWEEVNRASRRIWADPQ